jgi:Family of unknown function (DUF6308)
MKRVTLRGGVEIEDPLAAALAFVEAYPGYDFHLSNPASFDESDLRHANRGGARISAVEITAILERRSRIEHALRSIDTDASLTGRSIPWDALTRLFDAFGGIRGLGYSKVTKALHPKRPALIPMLDSVVQAYLGEVEPDSFGERATALVRSYKEDLDRNRAPLRAVQRELARRGYQLTEVRILDILIWSSQG